MTEGGFPWNSYELQHKIYTAIQDDVVEKITVEKLAQIAHVTNEMLDLLFMQQNIDEERGLKELTFKNFKEI